MRFVQSVVHTPDGCVRANLVVKSTLQDAHAFLDYLHQLLVSVEYDPSDCFAIQLAVEEALTNAIEHGNGMDPTRPVSVRFTLAPDQFRIRIRDDGPGFDVAAWMGRPLQAAPAQPGSRGLWLMRRCVDSVRYNHQGNVVTLTRTRKV